MVSMTKSSFSRRRNKFLKLHSHNTLHKFIHAQVRAKAYPAICIQWLSEIEKKENRPKRPNPNPDMPKFTAHRTPTQHAIAHRRALNKRNAWAKKHRLKLKAQGLI